MSLWNAAFQDAGTPLHASLLDPASTPASEVGKLAERLDRAGTDLFLIGGSTDVTGEGVQATVQAIAEVSNLPKLLFPSSHSQVARGLDGLLFTLTFNSTRQEVLIEEPARGAGPVRQAELEAITTAYVIVEPGMTVGRVAQAKLVTRDREGEARVSRYAELAGFLGLDAIYLEAGSGAPEPVPPALVEAAVGRGPRVIVGGGIRTAEQASAAAKAGADVVVTGTVAEDGELDAVAGIIQAVHSPRP